MHLRFKKEGTKLIVELSGELDHHSAEEVRNNIDDKLEREKPNVLIMDFSGVTFMDSSGIGVVIGRYKKLSMREGKVLIANINRSIRRVFDISGLYKIVKVYDSVEEALKSV